MGSRSCWLQQCGLILSRGDDIRSEKLPGQPQLHKLTVYVKSADNFRSFDCLEQIDGPVGLLQSVVRQTQFF